MNKEERAMEAALRRSGHGVVVKEERRPEAPCDDDEGCRDKAAAKVKPSPPRDFLSVGVGRSGCFVF